jgi:NAD-dependent dihydropyrimidine dehydrogenase PreA subunit
MKKKNRYDRPHAGVTDPSQCNGCGVCMLSCPVWHQHHTKALTYCGRNRASIGGASDEDVAAAAASCILCGSCEPLCPMGIRTQQATIALRQRLVRQGLLPKPGVLPKKHGPVTSKLPRVLLPGRALSSKPMLVSLIIRLLGKDFEVFPEYGCNLKLDLESGREISDQRMEEFLAPLRKAAEIIVSDGLLFNLLHSVLPSSVTVRPLGQALLSNPKVREGLKPGDFYMIETRAYNANRRDSIALYEEVRQEAGCFMNLDLQRVATPSGASSYQHRQNLPGIISVEAQVKWLLEGRSAQRIVTEHLDDHEAFSRFTTLPVVHLAEVAL